MAPVTRMKAAVLVSGRGSNLQALLDAAADPAYPAEIVLVLSNVPGAYALERAKKAGVATAVVNHKDFDGREPFEAAMQAELEKAGAEVVCLAGFMRILTDGFVNAWRDRLINIHPSLLPAFRGLHVQKRAIEYGARFSGCTVHFVRAEMDDGPIIVQAVVPILRGDDEDRLAARILEQEHRVYPLALRLVAEGRCRIESEAVLVDEARAPEGALVNPSPE